MQWVNRFLSSSSHCTFYFSWLPVALRRLWNWLLLFFAFSLKPKCHFDSAPYKWPFRWPPPFATQKSTQSICLPLVSWRISRLAARPKRWWEKLTRIVGRSRCACAEPKAGQFLAYILGRYGFETCPVRSSGKWRASGPSQKQAFDLILIPGIENTLDKKDVKQAPRKKKRQLAITSRAELGVLVGRQKLANIFTQTHKRGWRLSMGFWDLFVEVGQAPERSIQFPLKWD